MSINAINTNLFGISSKNNVKVQVSVDEKKTEEKTQTTQNNETQKESVTPLNVKYNKLTAGFRADTKLAR